MNRRIEKLTTDEFKNIINELTENALESMKIPGCDRNTDIETYHVGEDGEFISMILFRGEVIASALIWRNQVIATMYNSDNETDVLS